MNLRSSQGFSSAFYGEEISEALFLQVLDDASHRDLSLEVMCHPAFIQNTICSLQCLLFPTVNGAGSADISVVEICNC